MRHERRIHPEELMRPDMLSEIVLICSVLGFLVGSFLIVVQALP